ncbi:Non-specific lipid-transfer protein cw18 [Heracleum sosnowskyi]|uniref:Non-specific lipid-transfer protein n=1 Tax=Heracleum sosnowskyi TaxID=360622 RepID=A0AAD8IN20_9APIA|nr:Non-specific lipid-transfer protein cw18 [Heracleum sosnowskyi]
MAKCIVMVLVVLALIINPACSISCQEAVTKILPCEPYLLGFASVSVPCCQAVAQLNQLATSKPELKALCICLKQAAQTFHVNAERARQLPGLCHVVTPVPIDPNVNCDVDY